MKKERCTATAQSGRPCRAWATRDSEARFGRPLCAAHQPPVAETEEAMAILYARHFSRRELTDLLTVAAGGSLQDEIAACRLMLARLLAYVAQAEDLADRELERMGRLVFYGGSTLANLLRTQRTISGAAVDGISGAIAQALDELSTEWEAEL